MTPWAIASAAVAGWVATSIICAPILGRFLAARTPARGASPPPAPASPGEGRPAPQSSPQEGQPSPGLTPHEHAALARYAALAHMAIRAGHAAAAREIADGLRGRCPAVDDATLGVIAMDLRGYAVTLAVGVDNPARALQAVIDCLGLAAEDLTRLARTEGVPFDARD